MAKNKDNRVTVKLPPEAGPLLESLRRARKDQGRIATHLGIVLEGLEILSCKEADEANIGVANLSEGWPAHHREAHRMLEEILAGDEERAGWIVGNLKTFVDAIRAAKPTGRQRRAANEM